jgi:hypothetical protein
MLVFSTLELESNQWTDVLRSPNANVVSNVSALATEIPGREKVIKFAMLVNDDTSLDGTRLSILWSATKFVHTWNANACTRGSGSVRKQLDIPGQRAIASSL